MADGPIGNAGDSAASGAQSNTGNSDFTFESVTSRLEKGETITPTDLKKLGDQISKSIKDTNSISSLRNRQTDNVKQLKKLSDTLEKIAEQQKQDIDNQRGLSDTERQAQKEQIDKELDANKKELQALNEINLNASKAELVLEALKLIGEQYINAFNKVEEDNKKYRVQINTRLQGIENPLSKRDSLFLTISQRMNQLVNNQDKYGKFQAEIAGAFGTSSIIKQETLLENINTLVSQGVARDVEQRATLQALSDTIANTYEGFSKDISRLIRVQQEDQSTVMLGMESILTQMLNAQFRDTSYLTDIGTSSITGALTEALAGMSGVQGSAFNFTVQKYLASLYSMGASQSMIQNLASAINALYSGNVSGVSGDMQSLFAISAARSGQSYADILTKGIDGSNVNDLLNAMVGYLAEIAGRNSNVTRAALGGVFGTNVSDLIAAQNLKRSGLEDIYSVGLTQENAIGAVRQGMKDALDRLGFAGQWDITKSNLLYSSAASFIGSGGFFGGIPGGQLTWDLIKDIKGLAGGVGVTDTLNLGTLITAIIGGLGLVGSLSSAFTSVLQGNFGGHSPLYDVLGLFGADVDLINSEWWNTTESYGKAAKVIKGGAGGGTRGGGAGRTQTGNMFTETTGAETAETAQPVTSEQMEDWMKKLVQDDALKVRVVNLDEYTIGEGKEKSLRIASSDELPTRSQVDTVITSLQDTEGTLAAWRGMIYG